MRILRGLRLKVLALGGLTVVAFLAGLVGNGKPAVGDTFTWPVCNICTTNAESDPLCDDCQALVGRDNGGLRFCRSNWTAACMELAKTECSGVVCNCPHSVCDQGEALYPGCDKGSPHGQCVENMGRADPYCSGIFWDQVCVNEVADFCDVDC